MPLTADDVRKRQQALRNRARTMTKRDLDLQFKVDGDRVLFTNGLVSDPEYGDSGVPLIPAGILNSNDIPKTKSENDGSKTIKAAIDQYKNYYKEDKINTKDTNPVSAHQQEAEQQEADAESAGLPSIVDHRPTQSAVKSQGSRETCVAHASLALLEAFSNIPDDLSEQLAHFQCNAIRGRKQDQNIGFKPVSAAELLADPKGFVCPESAWPYISNQKNIDKAVKTGSYNVPAAALAGKRYGIGRYQLITQTGAEGESIQNPRYLEALLHRGQDIVIGVWMAWNDRDRDGILEPVVATQGKSLISYGGHAMLVVGYNRPKQYFIVKNSWGSKWGHAGYAYLHYDFMRLYANEGYVVTEPKAV